MKSYEQKSSIMSDCSTFIDRDHEISAKIKVLFSLKLRLVKFTRSGWTAQS